MRCPACEFDNPERDKFCGNCGAPLAVTCPGCNSPVAPGRRFCGQCGTALTEVADHPAATGPKTTDEPDHPVAERRMCSILFCDLVGFTTLSEERDPEAVRELLGRYFDLARTLIARYGGTVEKFIGDAVMAVWGTPIADEHDAERAVRAALELVDAVTALGTEIGVDGLAARAGVVSGVVAVNLGATGQGMVAGDAVNTAARIQAAAEPGTVLVDEGTRKAAGEAIAFEGARLHELKGKQQPVEIWRVERVLSGVGGSQRVDGLEAQLVGRNAELRMVKELFHAGAERRTPRLVSVVGAAGVGKSRLGWEFEKYADGLADTVWWHRGRCLSYGDGVAFSALAEMVRQRFGIAEDDPPQVGGAKLRDGLPQWLEDQAEIDYVQPRLGHLLGVDVGTDAATPLSRAELFAGWRLFFERLAASGTVVLLVEDLQYADAGLLDFLEHLLDWARDVSIFMLTLSRPDIDARRPGWGTGRGNSTAVSLDPLDDAAMDQLLDGLVPGMSADAKGAVASRAEGIPLYAVETVRMLIDREVVQPIDGDYRLVGDIGDLTVPASLHSLLAARLDSFDADTRRLIADASVVGETFPRDALVATSGLPDEDVDRIVAELVRREVLTVRADPLSPERGQYAFVQTMLRDVARETQSRHDRKARHLAVAAHLQVSYADGGEEIADVIAAHLLDALAAVPDADDAAELRERAIDMLTRAGKRAERTGAPTNAAKAYGRAAELVGEDPSLDQSAAELWKQAGQCARTARDPIAVDYFTRAGDIYRRHGSERDAALADLEVAIVIGNSGRFEEGIRMARAALETLQRKDDAETVRALGSIAIFEVLAGNPDGDRLTAEALARGQARGLTDDRYALLLYARGLAHITTNRLIEGVAYLREAVVRAEAARDAETICLALSNLADALLVFDAAGAEESARRAVLEARRVGSRRILCYAVGNLIQALTLSGRWAEAEVALREAVTIDGLSGELTFAAAEVMFEGLHGRIVEDAERWAVLERLASESEDAQDWGTLAAARAMTAMCSGDPVAAVAHARRALEAVDVIGVRADFICWAWPIAVDAALALDDLAAADDLVAWLDGFPPGHVPPRLHGHRQRTVARLLDRRGDSSAGAAYEEAVIALRGTGSPYDVAIGLMDQGQFLVDDGSPDRAREVAAEALSIAERLGAPQLVEQARRLLPAELSRPEQAAAVTD